MPDISFALIESIIRDFAGASVRISPAYILVTVLIAFIIFRARRTEGRFLAWLLPKRILFHRSHWIDFQLFLTGRVLTATGVFGAVSLTTVVASIVLIGLGRGDEDGRLNPALVAILIALVNDFGVYWIHRWHHRIPAVWPFHAVHHSAEVLSPVTVYRKHPVYDLISQLGRSLLIGLLQGLVLALIAGKVETAVIASANAVYVLFHATGSNLRHSHIWLRYGTVLEHVLISPAQHQIHHSRNLRHRDKNYGEILAVWDWMFGTLYVPKGKEDLEFGLSDERGRAMPQPHASVSKALLVPFRESWQALRRGSRPTV